MIKLQDDRVMVREGAELTVLDLDDWRGLFRRCCRGAGVRDAGLVEEVTGVVRHVCRNAEEAGRPASVEEVDALVVQLLLDAGLRDAAARYQQERQIYPLAEADPEERVRLATADLETIIAGDPYFLSRPVAAIVSRLRESLAQLGLQSARVPFLRALARELWAQGAVRGGVAPEAGERWLIPADEMRALLAEHGGETLAGCGLEMAPVSALVPALRADLDMVVAAKALAGAAPTELRLIPALPGLATELGSLLRRLATMIEQRRGKPEPDALPVSLRLLELEALTTQVLPMRARQAAAFRAEIVEILAAADAGDLQLRIFLA